MDDGIHEVERGTSQLSGSIATSQQALDHNLDTVNSTYESFHKITETAEGAVSVQNEIFGTTKSAMFEDMDNMLSQIPLIIQDKYPEEL